MKFKSLVCAITYGCNSRCTFCNIWKGTPKKEIDVSYYKKLPSFETVNLTGGEPFLRNDIDEIIEIFKRKTKRIVISTNGLLTERILKTAKKYPWIGFRISFDGVGEKNDEMRGIPGAFKRCLETIRGLKKIGVKDIGICSTFGHGNEDQVEKLYELSKKLNVQFLIIVRHDSFYYNKANKPFDTEILANKLNWLIKKYLDSFNIKNYFRAYYTKGAIDFAKGKKRLMECDAGWTSFYLDPYGDVFPCVVLEKSMGNIKKERLEDIRERINCKLNCWMPCTVNQQIRKKPSKAMKWILKKKVPKFVRN